VERGNAPGRGVGVREAEFFKHEDGLVVELAGATGHGVGLSHDDGFGGAFIVAGLSA
jgi:hypothetical protein